MRENKYHDIDKQISEEINRNLIADGIESYPIKCQMCDGTGEIETDNNGPIGDCPVCFGKGEYELKVTK